MAKERLEQSLQQRLQQRINPQHVALGRVLEMNTPEFEDEVRRELDDNPALEIAEHDSLQPEDNYPERDDYNGDDAERREFDDGPNIESDDEDMSDYEPRSSNRSADDPQYDAVALAADDDDDMLETLMNRLSAEHSLSPDQTLIATYIIGNMDSNGYLTRPLQAIAGDLAVSEGIMPTDFQMKEVFNMVRNLDPAGIGAIDLRDCLLLQLARRENDAIVATAREILTHYFDVFSKRHFDRLQTELDISREDMGEALELIRTLNPKPGAVLGGGRSSDRSLHISPDFILDYDEVSDRFSLSLAGNIPELVIEESFRADTERENYGSGSADRRRREAAEYVRRKRESAADFIALTRMRSQTLMAICRAIVDIQHNFFVSGDSADIRPMILKDVSAKTGLDISAVSRSVSGKYILAPHGIYSLKSLFNERPNNDNEASTPAILKALGEIIDTEDKDNPLSDRELTDALYARGFNIARRTVAKYRERLGYPVGRLRKQL